MEGETRAASSVLTSPAVQDGTRLEPLQGQSAPENFADTLQALINRVQELEQRLNVTRGTEPAPPQIDTQEQDAASAEPMVLEQVLFAASRLNRVEWFEFKMLAGVAEKDACAIDVLIGDPIIDDDEATATWHDYLRRPNPKLLKHTGLSPITRVKTGTLHQEEDGPLPERIRIHSAALLKIIDTILGSQNSRMMTRNGRPLVFHRPFKSLIYCESALREWCSTLEAKFNKSRPNAENATEEPQEGNSQPDAKQTDTAAQNGSTTDGAERDDAEDDVTDITKSEAALSHLKCLLNFIDTTITPKIDQISMPDLQEVVFADLWHLFRPGMEVIQNDGRQAYRVLKVATAKHRGMPGYPGYNVPESSHGSSTSSSSSDRHDRADFHLTCVYIDFDGRNIGPRTREFEFERYEGERHVTSFDVFPLRYYPFKRADFSDAEWKECEKYPENQRFREKLIRRGQKFLDVAGVKHMYYAGPTFDITREEMEGQVVVDFDSAFSVNERGPMPPPGFRERQVGPIQRAKFRRRPELERVAENAAFDINRDRGINCYTCCKDDIVFDEAIVDGKQTKEYIESLFLHKGMKRIPSVAIMSRPFKEVRASNPISEDDLVIMSFRVHGFILRSRRWADLDLSYLTDVESSYASDARSEETPEHRYAFDRLVLPEGHKPVIISLIAQHFRNKENKDSHLEQVDIVMGKGKGLIMLLHGAPGVGKTSTAEGVAELFKKPLFQITCGDLGTTAKEVEVALETNFALASRWGCILLLDEADVFLAERTKEDFQRNGLVAVFLRILEYYAGVLFLTTNRVGDFDEAFTSRIHISLHYPELNQAKTLEVFKTNMELIAERFASQKRRIEIDMLGVGSFASKHFDEHPHARWNGRQIRNACQTALALAEFEAQGNSHEAILRPDAVIKLTVDHFNTVRNAYLEFTQYMTDLYGSNAARRAKEGRLRAIWLDENDRVVGTGSGDRAAAFLRATQNPVSHQPPGRQGYYQYDHNPRQPGPQSQGYSQDYPEGRFYQQDPGSQRQPQSSQSFHQSQYADQHLAQSSRSPQPHDGGPYQMPSGQQFFAARQATIDLNAGANRSSFQDGNPGRHAEEASNRFTPSEQADTRGQGRPDPRY